MKEPNITALILDSGPLITQSFGSLCNLAKKFYTTPSVLTELKDETARQNLLLWGDKLIIKHPGKSAIAAVSNFAKKTGDYSVLSSTDIHLLALGYEIDVELNGGSKHLFKEPKFFINKPDIKPDSQQVEPSEILKSEDLDANEWITVTKKEKKTNKKKTFSTVKNNNAVSESEPPIISHSDSEDGEWISPDTLAEHLFKNGSITETEEIKPILTAISTGDFAMQNVLMQIGLKLVNPINGKQITKIRNQMLRCHGCFYILPFPSDNSKKHFCSRCGGITLLRCTVSNENGIIKVHLKKNMQWSTRGNIYPLPVPQSNMARKCGHSDSSLLLREDQKEYYQAVKQDKWKKKTNEKFLQDWVGGGSAENVISPFHISGSAREATRHTGVKVGKGRYVNSNKPKLK